MLGTSLGNHKTIRCLVDPLSKPVPERNASGLAVKVDVLHPVLRMVFSRSSLLVGTFDLQFTRLVFDYKLQVLPGQHSTQTYLPALLFELYQPVTKKSPIDHTNP